MKLGDVVLYKNQAYINLGILTNREGLGSMSYDRVYQVIPISNNSYIHMGNLRDALEIEVKGCAKLPFIEAKEWIPYDIKIITKTIAVNGETKREDSRYVATQRQPKAE